LLVAKAEYNYYPEQVEEQERKRQVKGKKKIKTVNKRMYISIAIIIFITSLYILYGYSKITSARIEITKLEREKLELEKVKQDLIGKLENIKSTTKISDEAIYNLGMIYPEENQIVYVSVNETTNDKPETFSISEKLKNIVTNFSSLF
jgi:cell division protein FtsL